MVTTEQSRLVLYFFLPFPACLTTLAWRFENKVVSIDEGLTSEDKPVALRPLSLNYHAFQMW